MKHTARILMMLVLTGGPALAQKTGTLLHPSDADRWKRSLGPSPSAESIAKHDTIFAALVADPSLTGFARSSAWTASVVPVGSSKEARIQANLCDIVGALCGETGASSLMLAGPLNTSDDFTELADLDGLVGSARVQASYTTNSTRVGSYQSFSAMFSQPTFAYRDSATLGRRSVDHAAYSVEAGGGYRWPAAALQGAVRWQHGYRARTAQNVCTPASFGPVGTQTCSSIVVGAPSDTGRMVASLGGAWSIGGNAAMRLTISHDITHSVTGIDLPVWVIRNSAGGLAGGVRFGYRTDAKQVTAALFVSEFKL